VLFQEISMEIQLSATQQIALRKLAHREKRKARDQAALLIVRELERAGLLSEKVHQPQQEADHARA
jgi:hypothetical protein